MNAMGLMIGKETLCCFCAEGEVKKSDYPMLSFMAMKNVKVPAEKKCTCGLSFGRPQALEAAVRIAEMLEEQY